MVNLPPGLYSARGWIILTKLGSNSHLYYDILRFYLGSKVVDNNRCLHTSGPPVERISINAGTERGSLRIGLSSASAARIASVLGLERACSNAAIFVASSETDMVNIVSFLIISTSQEKVRTIEKQLWR